MSHGSRGHTTASPAVRGRRWLHAVAGIIPAIVLLISFTLTTGPASASTGAPAGLAAAAGHRAGERPSTVLCDGYTGCNRAGYNSHGYGQHRTRSYWRMDAGDECTNYVAYVEATTFGVRAPRYLLGNAEQWPGRAWAHGVSVSRVPRVGSVAVWGGSAYGIGPLGHVAVVEKVGPHDSYIIVSQQHLLAETNGYDWTRINAGFPSRSWEPWPRRFIHFHITRR